MNWQMLKWSLSLFYWYFIPFRLNRSARGRLNTMFSLSGKRARRVVTLNSMFRHCSSLHAQKLKIGGEMPKDDFIAYKKYTPSQPAKDIGVIFCQGLMSNMNGLKAKYLEKYCKDRSISYVCFDYMGHGESSGKFEDFSIGLWKNNTLEIMDKVADQGPQILVGSSIGGWIMLLAALENPSRVHSLVGIAPAPDLLYKRYKNLPIQEKDNIKRNKFFLLPSDYNKQPYQISYEAILDAGKNLVLDKAEVPFDGAVRLIHGMNDATVPYPLSLKLAQKLRSDDVYVHLIKDGDHRMSRNENLDFLAKVLDGLILCDASAYGSCT